eukprot:6207117-Pleurochrysis_carterae.AAC.1
MHPHPKTRPRSCIAYGSPSESWGACPSAAVTMSAKADEMSAADNCTRDDKATAPASTRVLLTHQQGCCSKRLLLTRQQAGYTFRTHRPNYNSTIAVLKCHAAFYSSSTPPPYCGESPKK